MDAGEFGLGELTHLFPSMHYLSNFVALCIVALFFRLKNFYHDAIMLCSNSLSIDSNSIINALM